jgi:hypothetical protein
VRAWVLREGQPARALQGQLARPAGIRRARGGTGVGESPAACAVSRPALGSAQHSSQQPMSCSAALLTKRRSVTRPAAGCPAEAGRWGGTGFRAPAIF